MEDGCLYYIKEVIAINNSIEYLDLSLNRINIHYSNIKYLEEALEFNNSIKTLNLENSYFCEEDEVDKLKGITDRIKLKY